MDRTKPPRVLYALYLAYSLSGGLGLLIPLVALVLVLAYGFGHFQGAARLFLAFLTLTAFASALPGAIRLGQTLRLGSLKVSGAIVRRSEEPLRFWSWVGIMTLFGVIHIAGAIFLAWVTLHSST